MIYFILMTECYCQIKIDPLFDILHIVKFGFEVIVFGVLRKRDVWWDAWVVGMGWPWNIMVCWRSCGHGRKGRWKHSSGKSTKTRMPDERVHVSSALQKQHWWAEVSLLSALGCHSKLPRPKPSHAFALESRGSLWQRCNCPCLCLPCVLVPEVSGLSSMLWGRGSADEECTIHFNREGCSKKQCMNILWRDVMIS